jgi:S-adenosylmethionine decarboxylase
MIKEKTNKLDYFMKDEKGSFAGLHMILDMYQVEKLDQLEWIETGLINAAKIAKANILHSHMHHFGHEQGVSGVIVLSESHISVHSWPEKKYMAIDVFMCGNTSPHKAIEYLVDYFDAGEHKCSVIRRGSMDE